ncbi:hypothetical protein AVEN_163470-1 [Araneus ventricosus]|uniref:Uncharacterized protein n=1 Tax=Araneus ventricosus TaxID=182803 RepID=A0A4Y2JWX7_ARAVE|nr:hypothetical protein AVEN_163470-1 [Araneus ventricosus]
MLIVSLIKRIFRIIRVFLLALRSLPVINPDNRECTVNVKRKLEILQKLDNGESASTDTEDVLNVGNKISHSAALHSVETLLDYMGQRGFDYGDITAVRKICVDIRQETNKQQKQRRITDFLKH